MPNPFCHIELSTTDPDVYWICWTRDSLIFIVY